MTVEVFWGEEPKVRSEVQFLTQLKADLGRQGIKATILVNFFTNSSSRQIDFFVITDSHACHVELKNYNHPLVGLKNGLWSSRCQDGSLEPIDRQNPYAQALGCKFALSDDMHSLAFHDSHIPQPAEGKFYTQFDSVICVFPGLEQGSQVPSDYKVKTLGYTEFVAFLTTPGAHPPWNRAHWMAFILTLGLIKTTTSGQQELSATATLEIISSYSRRFIEFYSRRLHEIVSLPLNCDGTLMPSTHLIEMMKEINHVQLVGPSGCGKSHLAKHTALATQGAKSIAFLVEANMYEGRLSALLNRSVGRFSTRTMDDLLQAASINGQKILLVVDGFNECPHSLQERLLGDLSAFCLRAPALTLITSQAPVLLPKQLDSKVILAGDLSEADRKAILSSYGSPEILPLCDTFSTAYELSIASECASELPETATRAKLFDAFVRKRLSDVMSPAFTRETLRHLALAMDERLTSSLPIDDVWRIAEQFLMDRSAPASVIDDVFNCTITLTQQGKFSFSHELMGRFLTAEGLLLKHRLPMDLARELKKPRHQDLAQFAVALETDAARLDQLFSNLAEWQLSTGALVGASGPLAARVVRLKAIELLKSITDNMGGATFIIRPEYELLVSGGHKLSDADRSLLAAVGALVLQGQFVQETVALLDATDAACRRSADIQAMTEMKPPVSVIVAAVLAGLSINRTEIAAWAILDACEQTYIGSRFRPGNDGARISENEIAGLLSDASSQGHGRLLLLCCLLNSATSLEAAALAPLVLRMCWDSSAYHVQLEGLRMVQSFAAATEGHPLHDTIVDILESFDTTRIHIMLSSQLVDTMNSYGMIESPVETSYVTAEIDEVLRGSPIATAEQCARAYGIVTTQFEDIVGEAYYIAIAALDSDQRSSLFTIAALGAPPDGFWSDWLLRQLIGFADRRTLPAFERWASHLDIDASFIQGVGSCYALAMKGCARFLETPPQLKDPRSKDELAWQCYGAVIFWLHRPGLTDEDIAERCRPLWRNLRADLLPAAADPLYWLSNPSVAEAGDGIPIIRQTSMAFPEDVLAILEWSLEHRDSITSIFGHRGRGLSGHSGGLAGYIADILGAVGNADTVELLRRYVDDSVLGSTAIRSIRKLTDGQT